MHEIHVEHWLMGVGRDDQKATTGGAESMVGKVSEEAGGCQ